MAGELSPDGFYYWDGERWVSAFSADGRWHWNGAVWEPVRTPRSGPRTALIVGGAIGAVALVAVLAIAGVALAPALTSARVPPPSQKSAGAEPFCSKASASVGAAVKTGDSTCTGRLGALVGFVDCTLPSGKQTDEIAPADSEGGSGIWQPVTLNSSPSGCLVGVAPGHETNVLLKMSPRLDTVAITDFAPTDANGVVGIQVACMHGSCVDFVLRPSGAYMLSQEQTAGLFDMRVDGLVAPGGYALGRPNRVIVSIKGLSILVYLNGQRLVAANLSQPAQPGRAAFYVDDRHYQLGANVSLLRMLAFATG